MATKVEVKQIDALNGGETKVVSVAGLNLVQWLYNLDDVQPYTGKQNQALIVNDAGNGTEWNDGSKLKAIKNIISGVVKVAKAALADLAEKAKLADRATIADDVTNVDGVPAYYAYAMTKAEFDARRQANKALYAGSGFVEWGKHLDTAINEGMWATGGTTLVLGRTGGSSTNYGTSRTMEPIVSVDGTILHLTQGIGHNAYLVQFPDAPNGTKTNDSATGVVFDFATQSDPKYGNVASDTNEAVARAFEGMVKNGDFRNGASEWQKSSTTTIDTTGASFINNGEYIFQTLSLTNNATYEIEVYLSSGNGKLRLQTLGTATETPIYTGLNKFNITMPSNSQAQRIQLFSMTAGAKCKHISVRPVTNQVITTRKDLVFLETWHEAIDDKGVIYPLGNVQFGASSWNGIAFGNASGYGVAQGYAAFGEWDKTTTGYCKPSTSSDKDGIAKLLSDPRNNIYYDSETKKLIQVRYRLRVVEGLGDEWASILPVGKKTLCYLSRLGALVTSQGKGTSPAAQDWQNSFVAHDHDGNQTNSIGCFEEVPSSTNFALPIALVQRLNQGVHHPVYNPFGCTKVRLSGFGYVDWYSSEAIEFGLNSTKDCFGKISTNPAGTENTPCNHGSGYIGGQGSGRQTNDPYKFYDAIYAGQVEDLRLSAHKQDPNKLLEDAIRKAVAGEMRGKGKIPFLKNIGKYNFPNSSVSGNNGFVYANTGLIPWITERKINIAGNGAKALHVSTGEIRTISRYIDNGTNIYVYFEAFYGSSNPPVGEWIVVRQEWLTPEFDTLPWIDIIGAPENIAATFPNGIAGMWIPQIPDGTSKEFFANRKALAQSAFNVYTENNGQTWVSQGWNWDSVKNSLQLSLPANRVSLVQYSTLSNFTEQSNNAKVVGNVGNVYATSHCNIDTGNRLNGSLTGNIGKSNTNYLIGNANVITHVIYTSGKLSDAVTLKTTHSQFVQNGTGTANNSPAVKALYTLTEKDGLLYLQLHGNEMKYKTPDKPLKTLNTSGTVELTNHEVYLCQGGSLNGLIIQALKTVSVISLDKFGYINGDLIDTTTGLLSTHAEIWNGSGWGDDSTIPIINGERTKEDLNGNTVKTFCHHTMIPLGIASYTDSSQAK